MVIMKKFLNKPEKFVDEMIEGILAAHPNQLTHVANDLRCIVKAGERKKGKVGLATGGGSGHLPLFLGYVGEGMLDGCAVGGVFQSPSAEQMLNVTKAIDAGAGVLYIYGNYGGDILNFDMAAEMAEMDNIRVLSLVGADDVASASKGEEDKRRGVAGIFFIYKIAGAKADELAPIEEVKRVAEKAAANVRTMGVALTPCIVPEVGKPGFTIADDEMEIGMGIHGEPGIHRGKLKPADDVVDTMMSAILEDLPFKKDDQVSVLINGLGATPKEEMYIIYRRIARVLKENAISVFHVYVGEFATSMEMTGFSISLLKLDDELKQLLVKPARTPFFEQAALKV
jgi:dihydroxyacetone kinase-like protein